MVEVEVCLARQVGSLGLRVPRGGAPGNDAENALKGKLRMNYSRFHDELETKVK